MKKTLQILLIAILLLAKSYGQNSYWKKISEKDLVSLTKMDRATMPSEYQLYSLDLQVLKSQLNTAPNDLSGQFSTVIIGFPNDTGGMSNFRIYDSPIMEEGLAEKFPDIKTYLGKGIDDPTAIMRFSITPFGLHVMMLSGTTGTTYIDTYTKDLNNYIVYNRTNIQRTNSFECSFDELNHSDFKPVINEDNFSSRTSDGKFRIYRLAMACTGEYAAFHGGTVALAQAAIVVTVNRVNTIFERDFSARLNLVANNNLLIYTDAGTDPYTNSSGFTMLGQNQTNVTNVIGSVNYDIGHVVSTGGGGVAGLGVFCNTSNKARGVTGLTAPIGDVFDIDYVAHEIGHQFGCNHTFNNSCGGNRNNSTAVEPGSGSTIMAYAGICPPNVQNNSDAHFSFISIAEANARTFVGTSCATVNPNGNIAPVVDAGSDYIIPRGTAFILKGSATDANGDALTYCWEQTNTEISTQSPVQTSTTGPNFRSNPPIVSPDRYMPRIQDVVNNNLAPTWEVIPNVARTMNFALTVRDNRAPNGGQTGRDDMVVTTAAVGPFLVTSPNANVDWAAGTSQDVTWDVAGTTTNGINATNVDIFLSTDGGFTYPITLATNVPNDGLQSVVIPNNIGTSNRIMVKGNNHIFYDISNTNFTISQSLQTCATAANQTASVAVTCFDSADGSSTITLTPVPSEASITYTVDGGSLQTASLVSGAFTISGLTAGTHAVVISNSGCSSLNATATIAISSNESAGAASSTPTLCLNTVLTNITHTTTGVTGIGTAIDLPNGVSAVWSNDSITISGTPTVAGTFNYSIPLTGGCGSVSATGTITVYSLPTVTASTTASSICSGSAAELNATGASYYNWSGAPIFNFNTTNASSVSVPNVTSDTTFSVVGVDANSCSSAPVPVSITVIQLTTNGSVTTSICAGETYVWPANSQSYTTNQTNTTFVDGCNTATLNLTITPQLTWYADADNDTYGNPAVTQQSCTQPSGYVSNNIDCNDSNPAINPLATEICWNNIDDNCNNTKSEGCAAIPVYVNNPVTITNFSTHLSAVPYTYPGATSLDYRYEVTNISVTPNQTVTFTQTGVFARYFTIPTSIRGFDTDYAIRASAVINGEEVPYVVPVIIVRSSGIPTVKLAPTSCGAELSRLDATISASPGFNATLYKFRIRLTSDNGTMPTYYYSESPSRFISANSFLGLSLQYNSSYSVSVQYTTANVGAAVTTVTAEYGEECIITTPRIPLIGLSTPTCGTTLDRLGATISATPATYAVQYQFRVRLTSDNGPTPTYYTTIPSASRYSSLMAVQGLVLENNTQYSVSVRYSIPVAGVGTEFSAYGSECILVTPGAAPILRIEEASFKVVAYPNPFSEGFQLDVKTENAGIVSIKTYDMLGRLIEERSSKVNTLESLTIGSNYPSGVYNVIVSQEDEIRTVRVVKR